MAAGASKLKDIETGDYCKGPGRAREILVCRRVRELARWAGRGDSGTKFAHTGRAASFNRVAGGFSEASVKLR